MIKVSDRPARPWRAVAVLAILVATCTGSGAAQPAVAAARPIPRAVAGGGAGGPATGCPAGPGRPIGGLRAISLPCLTDPGHPVDVAAGHGRAEVINIWASWCDPCRREAPLLEAAYRAAAGRVLFLGVDSQDERRAALRFVAAAGVTYPQVFDASARFARGVGAVGMPYTLIVDATGRVVYRQIGVLTPAALRAGLVRAGVAVPVPG